MLMFVWFLTTNLKFLMLKRKYNKIQSNIYNYKNIYYDKNRQNIMC